MSNNECNDNNNDKKNENIRIRETLLKNKEEYELSREEITKTVSSLGFLQPNHPLFWHGRLFAEKEEVSPPKVVWESSSTPRDDHDEDTPDWLTASEYNDVDSVMEEKIDCLANLLRYSRKTVIYSGAGISVAAGIGQAARAGGRRRRKPPAWMTSTTAAKPTFTHHALTALMEHGYMNNGSWVQQNHDGLPQKAGYPQEKINEIHGSWFDPSNPVILYSGSLRTKEYEWMVDDADTADLVLVVGTSLSGLNADQVAIKAAERSLTSTSLGMVMINLQQTPQDGKASLRIFGESDIVLKQVLSKLNISTTITTEQPKSYPTSHKKVLIPYDKNGHKTTTSMMWLDLTKSIKIVNHNIKGAKQPSQRHITTAIGEVIQWNDDCMAIELRIQKSSKMLLGYWWLEAAMEGRVSSIPIVNVEPKYCDENEMEQNQ